MTGLEYEYYCAERLKANGYRNVQVTKASGDYGIDVLAEKDGITFAVQCKYYENPVGIEAVYEAIAGKQYYDAAMAAVMTNNTFTPAARKMARKSHVLLWDYMMPDQRAELAARARVAREAAINSATETAYNSQFAREIGQEVGRCAGEMYTKKEKHSVAFTIGKIVGHIIGPNIKK